MSLAFLEQGRIDCVSLWLVPQSGHKEILQFFIAAVVSHMGLQIDLIIGEETRP